MGASESSPRDPSKKEEGLFTALDGCSVCPQFLQLAPGPRHGQSFAGQIDVQLSLANTSTTLDVRVVVISVQLYDLEVAVFIPQNFGQIVHAVVSFKPTLLFS